jgi:hypothetical protein
VSPKEGEIELKASQCQREVSSWFVQMRAKSKNWRVSCRIFFLLLSMLVSGCGTLAGSHGEVQPKALLDQIWPYFPPPKRVMSKQDQQYAEVALVRWLETCLDEKYEVIDQRIYWPRVKQIKWAGIGKEHGNRIRSEEWGGVEIEPGCNGLDYNPVITWQVNFEGELRFFAITMTDQPVPGSGSRHLFGRFELRKKTDNFR